MSDPYAKTQPLPTVQTGRADDTVVIQRPPRKKRRGLAAVITIVLVLALLIAAFFVGDYFARKAATGYVAQQAATAAGLKSTKDVHVDLGKGLFLPQLLVGRINNVTVSIEPLTVSGITGTLVIRAHGVPTDTSKPVGQLRVDVAVPVSSLAAKASTDAEAKKLGLKLTASGKHLLFSFPLSIFGEKIPIGVTTTPRVTKGKVALGIDGIQLGQNRIAATQLDRIIPGFSSLVESGQSVCIASVLPKEFALKTITLDKKVLHFGLNGDGAILDHAALSQKGTC